MPTEAEVSILQALADSTSVVMESLRVKSELETLVLGRTAELHELKAFSSAVSHDLRGPLQTIGGFAELLSQFEAESLTEQGREYVDHICGATSRLANTIDDLMRLSRAATTPLQRTDVDLSALATTTVENLRARDPERTVTVRIESNLRAWCDAGLLGVVLNNLIGNAWKFTARREDAVISVGASSGDPREFFVRDNGVGFDASRAGELFGAFQRLHAQSEFPGTGIGLCTVHRIVQRHGGVIRAESAVGEGATFSFTLA
jgi:light-regulated signal transduction histidine kinase (bacteriophytochrome)